MYVFYLETAFQCQIKKYFDTKSISGKKKKKKKKKTIQKKQKKNKEFGEISKWPFKTSILAAQIMVC